MFICPLRNLSACGVSLLLPLAALSCRVSSEPPDPTSALIATAVTSATDDAKQELVVVNPQTGTLVGRKPLAGILLGMANLPNTSSAVALSATGIGREAFAFDIASLRTLWTASLPLEACCSEGQSVRVSEAPGLLVLPPQDIVFFGAKRANENGFAIVDVATRTVKAFAPDSSQLVVGAALLPRDGSRADVMILSRQKGVAGSNGDRIVVLDGTTLTTRSVITRSDLGFPDGPFVQVLGFSSGARLFAVFPGRIVLFDMSTRTVIAQRSLKVRGRLSISPDDQWLCLSDQGEWPDTPGSGLLRMIKADLSSDRLIDVSSPLGGTPDSPTATVSGPSQFGADGNTLLVRTGTTRFGPLYPTQPARVLVVDLRRDALTRSIMLGGYDASYLVESGAAK